MAEVLLAFKAGRAFRRGDTNFVDPVATKGAIQIVHGEDDLLHFMWKNRTTGTVEEDLILFPSDATLVKASGRTYVLKFSSSDQRHFFWLQDASSARDDEFIRNVNGLLEDPEYTLNWASTSSEASTSAQAASSSNPSNFQATPEQIQQLSSILTQMAGNNQSQSIPEMSLSDILTPANITPLFTTHPQLISTLFPHLPPDLPTPPSAEAVERIINSPQFRAAVSNFDQALRTGLLGGLVRGLGLPEEAGTGIGPFLRAVQEQADEQNTEDRMDTD